MIAFLDICIWDLSTIQENHFPTKDGVFGGGRDAFGDAGVFHGGVGGGQRVFAGDQLGLVIGESHFRVPQATAFQAAVTEHGVLVGQVIVA